MSCEVWVFSPKSPGIGRKKAAAERRAGGNAFVDGRGSERACGAAEYREHVVEAMLETDVQRVLRFVAVQRESLSAAIEEHGATGRVGVVSVPGAQAGVLNPGAIGEVGRRQQAKGLLPVAGQRLLRQIVGVVGGRPLNAPRSWWNVAS